MRNYFMLLFISTALIFNACKKGADGAQGEKGEPGESAVKTFIYSNKKVPSATLSGTYNDGTKTIYSFEGKLEITPPVTNYQEYYENGVVLVFLRNANYQNGVWISGVNEEKTRIYPASNDGTGVGIEVDEDGGGVTKDKIIIKGESSESSNSGGALLKSFPFDVKVVLIPASSVTKLSSVNTKDLGAVEKALGLYK